VEFDSKKACSEACTQLQKAILYDGKGSPTEAPWHRYSPDSLTPVMDEQEKNCHEDYKFAPPITWKKVTLGED
jgi:hypothetical protein